MKKLRFVSPYINFLFSFFSFFLTFLEMVMYNDISILVVILMVCFVIGASEGQLKVGFYSQKCPNAEATVKSVVKEASANDPRTPPVLLRLHFHDCFVEGCDGSILINDVPDAEKGAFEHQGVGGFDQIQKAKQKLEAQCPGVVSCADIVAMAARDAGVLAGGLFYEVETGRRDGKVSSLSLADDMPDVNDSIETLKSKFKKRGLSEEELVLLSGAHTIGTTACFFMTKRLYNFTGKSDSDGEVNPSFLPALKRQCPENGDVNFRIPLDAVTGDKFDDQLLRNIKDGTAVISSDARLYDDKVTKRMVNRFMNLSFRRHFPRAMVKMGRVGVKTGSNGEIRRACNSFN